MLIVCPKCSKEIGHVIHLVTKDIVQTNIFHIISVNNDNEPVVNIELRYPETTKEDVTSEKNICPRCYEDIKAKEVD